MAPPRLYLAGPEVFLSDADEIGRRKIASCAQFGFVGLFPLESGTDAGARSIFAANCALMRSADAGIFNLTPFRGMGADPGTAFELGFMTALGKPAFAYSHEAGSLLERMRQAGQAPRPDAAKDGNGLAIEDFGLADNLMLCAELAGQDRLVIAPCADPFRALDGFVGCLARARSIFALRASLA